MQSSSPVDPVPQKSFFAKKSGVLLSGGGVLLIASLLFFYNRNTNASAQQPGKASGADTTGIKDSASVVPVRATSIDTAKYQSQLMHITNGDTSGKWPVKTALPLAGAILPFNRVVAYYGNFYSTKMGVLGEYPPAELKKRLEAEIKKWEKADSLTPVIPAVHYIAVTAQGSPGKGNTYRLRMPFKQIDSAIALAASLKALVFLDIQVGLSNLQAEVPQLEQYLKMPNVHFGIDPEFSMKGGQKPGSVIGSFDAADINYVSNYLAKLVKENNLPPKMLVVHRFTQAMVTNYKQIKTQPEVQIVMDMDGWGAEARKKNTYRQFIYKEPVQFTGFKLFYKNDFREPKSRIMTPEEVLALKPSPLYIQYQ
jgi:hypothetical protein